MPKHHADVTLICDDKVSSYCLYWMLSWQRIVIGLWQTTFTKLCLWPPWLWPSWSCFVADMVCGRYGCGRYGHACGRYSLWPIWSNPHLKRWTLKFTLSCCIYWTTYVILIEIAGRLAWILICKHCNFGEIICYNSRDIQFFLGDYFFGRPVDICKGLINT